MVAGVRVDTHDKGVRMRDDRHGGHRTFPLVMDLVGGREGRYRSGQESLRNRTVRGHVRKGGQSSNDSVVVGRTGTGRPPPMNGQIGSMTPRGSVDC